MQQQFRRDRLDQEVLSACLDSLHGGGNIAIAGEKDDWQRRAEFAKANLQLGTAQIRNPDVEKDATSLSLIWQILKQIKSRGVGCDRIARLLEAALHRGPQGG